MYTIYLTTNSANNKQYVGQKLSKRDRDSYFGSGKLILKAIKKYGKENFTRINIDKASSQIEADQKELFWQKFYDCFNPKGYNIAIGPFGGDTMTCHPNRVAIGMKHSEDLRGKRHCDKSKLNMRNAQIGHIVSEETRKKISSSIKTLQFGENHPWYGKHLSKEHKEKISASLKSKRLVSQERLNCP